MLVRFDATRLTDVCCTHSLHTIRIKMYIEMEMFVGNVVEKKCFFPIDSCLKEAAHTIV